MVCYIWAIPVANLDFSRNPSRSDVRHGDLHLRQKFAPAVITIRPQNLRSRKWRLLHRSSSPEPSQATHQTYPASLCHALTHTAGQSGRLSFRLADFVRLPRWDRPLMDISKASNRQSHLQECPAAICGATSRCVCVFSAFWIRKFISISS